MLGTKFSGNTNSTTFMSTPSVNHTINDFGGNHNTSSNCSVKLSLSPHKSSHGTFLDSHSRFVQDPGCKLAVEKETWSPRLQNNFLSLWTGLKSVSTSISPNRFHHFEAKDLLLSTTKLAIPNLSVSSPGSVFHPCSPKWDEIREDTGRSRLCQTWELFPYKS